jgi:hypothetical protein
MLNDNPTSSGASDFVPKNNRHLRAIAHARRAGLAAIALTLLGIALSACAYETGPEPVALDQNPGNQSPPNAFGN